MKFTRKVLFQAVLALLASVCASWAGDKVTVMTKNMDAGTDFGFFVANLQNDPSLGVQLTIQEVFKNNYPLRASLLAQEIASAKPELVGLQEVTLWRTGPGTGPATVVIADQLQLLLDALTAQGQPYSVVAVNTLTDITFPTGSATFRYTDQDVIIVRADAPVGIGNVQSNIFSTLLPLTPEIAILRGWISADVTVGANTFRFVTTHLESSGSLYGNPLVDQIQAAQANELASILSGSPFPVVIAGDFNSNGTHTPPERTLSVAIMLSFGFTDTWSAVHRGIPGFTWPLYIEDPLRQHTQGPLERIDFIFARAVAATSSNRTGLKSPYSSDHAGVVSGFEF